jgi:hypothetical protein
MQSITMTVFTLLQSKNIETALIIDSRALDLRK